MLTMTYQSDPSGVMALPDAQTRHSPLRLRRHDQEVTHERPKSTSSAGPQRTSPRRSRPRLRPRPSRCCSRRTRRCGSRAHGGEAAASRVRDSSTNIRSSTSSSPASRPTASWWRPCSVSPGAGKSHLVRWIAREDPRQQPRRHVIYLQKTETSLKNVIEELLVDQTDPEFDEIRAETRRLGSGVTAEEMEQRILDALAEALRHHEADRPAAAKALVGAERAGAVLPRPTVPRPPAPRRFVRETSRQARAARPGRGRARHPARVHRRRIARSTSSTIANIADAAAADPEDSSSGCR